MSTHYYVSVIINNSAPAVDELYVIAPNVLLIAPASKLIISPGFNVAPPTVESTVPTLANDTE